MKAVILGAGRGTRLQPITSLTNKILLPLHDRPILWHVFEKVRDDLSITDPALVVREEEYDWFLDKKKLIEEQLGITITIIADDTWATKGMAGALYAAKDFVGSDSVVLIPGDNAFSGDLGKTVNSFQKGALVHRKKVDNPSQFGVGIYNEANELIDMVEKPKDPPSDWGLMSPHCFDQRCFTLIESLTPSARGEYEIIDLLHKYLALGELQNPPLDGQIFDVGTFESLLAANNFFAKRKKS